MYETTRNHNPEEQYRNVQLVICRIFHVGIKYDLTKNVQNY